MAIEHMFPSPSGSGVDDVIDIVRPDLQERIEQSLRKNHSCIITGEAGVGKDREGTRALRSFFGIGDQPNSQVIVVMIDSTDLLPNKLQGRSLIQSVLFDAISNCKANENFEAESDFLNAGESLIELRHVVDWFMQLGKKLNKLQVKLLLRFTSFGRVWFNESYLKEFRRTKAKYGELAELFKLLASIHTPARDSSQAWAVPFYSIVQGRCISEADLYEARETSNWRPGTVEVESFNFDEIRQFLERGWSSHWKDCEQNKICSWFMKYTGGVPQLVNLVACWVSDRVDQLSFEILQGLNPPIGKQTHLEWTEDLNNTLDFRFLNDRKRRQDACQILALTKNELHNSQDIIEPERLRNKLSQQFENISPNSTINFRVTESKKISVEFTRTSQFAISLDDNKRISDVFDYRVIMNSNIDFVMEQNLDSVDSRHPSHSQDFIDNMPKNAVSSNLTYQNETNPETLAMEILNKMPSGRAVDLTEILSSVHRTIRKQEDRTEVFAALEELATSNRIKKNSIHAGFASRGIVRYVKQTTHKEES